MAIYFSDKNDQQFHERGINVDDSASSEWAHKVRFAQADGHELEHACKLLGRDPDAIPKRIWTFVGVDALTIAMNW